MKKATVVLLAVGLLGLLGWAISNRLRSVGATGGTGPGGPGGSGGRGRSGPLAVRVAEVRQATVRDIGRFTGTLIPRSLVVIAPKVSGRLEALTVDVGDKVAGGAEIARLDAGDYDQQVDQAAAELAVAEASVAECRSSLDLADGNLGRVTELHRKKMAADSELDEVKAHRAACDAKLKVALAEITRRQAALGAAKVRRSYTTITVPPRDDLVTWVVAERFADRGAMLRANDPIVSVLDSTVVTAVIDVIERDYPKISVGQVAAVDTDAFPGAEFTGRIVRVAPLLRESSRQARVEVEVPNSDGRLKPGMFVRVSVEFRRSESATVVPVAALARRSGKVGVFRVVPGEEPKVNFVPLETDIVDGELVEVKKPALAGQVVTVGHHLLESGAAVKLPDQDSERPDAPKAGGPAGAPPETPGSGTGRPGAGRP
jgi:RND family efflux transporter MFP subunit